MAERYDPFAVADWTGEDAVNLRNFLKTPTGRRLVYRLRNDRPSLGIPPTSPSTLEAAALVSREAYGYEQAVNNLFTYLIEEAPQQRVAENYPDLFDDSLWPAELQGANISPAEPSGGKVDPNA